MEGSGTADNHQPEEDGGGEDCAMNDDNTSASFLAGGGAPAEVFAAGDANASELRREEIQRLEYGLNELNEMQRQLETMDLQHARDDDIAPVGDGAPAAGERSARRSSAGVQRKTKT